jgi:hypothetical protein
VDDVPLHVEASALDALDPATYQVLEQTARQTLEAQGEPSWAIIRPMLDQTMLRLLHAGFTLSGKKAPTQDVPGNAPSLETAVALDLQLTEAYKGRVDELERLAGQGRKYWRREFQPMLVWLTAWACAPEQSEAHAMG